MRGAVAIGLALGVAWLALACSPPGARVDRSEAVQVATPVWQVRGSGGLAAIEPGTRDLDLLDATTCAACHPAEHAEWAASRHAAAWTNGIFRREYREVPRLWCVRCHAPTAPQIAQAVRGGGPLADQGVGCAACHVRGGRLVARRRSARSPHDTLVAADFGSPAFCADCHQFAFPILADGEVVAMSEHPMQDTVAEFERGRFARAPDGCRTCHARSPAGHRYPGGHDQAMLERAIGLAWCRDRSTVVVDVSNRGAGHRVPTGDVHRHASLKLWRSSAPEALRDSFFGRRYEPDPRGGKRIVWDSSLAPGESRRLRVEAAELAGEPDEPINLALVYVLTGDETPARHRDPGESTTRVVGSDRRRFSELPRCESPAPVTSR